MDSDKMKQSIIANGVKNLHEFGYDKCTSENILTDAVYSQFFESMLKDNKGNGVDHIIDELLGEIYAKQ